ncbi:MAG: hypothetical protein KDI36_07735 [Pseudomonadales bacterium]|nr:hypothetical protein [Pseudomonadales bacterium]
MNTIRKSFALLAVVGIWMMASAAQAVTPANTILSNQAKLTYTGNPTGITASVDVTVSLVTANVVITPAFSVPSDQTKAENQSFSATYTVYAQNNGLDTYALSSAVTTNNNVTSPGTFTDTPSSIDLGATALSTQIVSTGSTTALTVPADGTSDGAINGLAAGDTVVIASAPYTILSITDNATGTSTINLTSALPAATYPVGEGIFESKTFTVTTTDVGSITNTAIPASIVVTTSVDNGTDAAFTDPLEIFIVQITITKRVRCITGCDDSGGTNAFDYDDTDNSTDGGGNNYFDGGVTAEPGGELEYLISMENPASTGTSLTSAVLSDTLPTFVSYKANSTKLNAQSVNDEGSAPVFPLDTGADDSGLVVGQNAGLAGAEDDGVITSGTTIYVVYRVTID